MRKEIFEALGAFKTVYNMDGKPNQFVLVFDNGTIFQSYKSIIVVEIDKVDKASLSQHSHKIYFGEDWNFSRTTSKYRNMFLSRDTKWCKDKVAKGEIILVLDI